MERLIGMYRNAEPSYPPEVKSAWLHHRFTQVHPFQDGNGRVARALASLVFLREGLFPLVIRESDRQEYIGALEAADAGDLSQLINLFARRQRDAILKALGLEQQVQQSKYADGRSHLQCGGERAHIGVANQQMQPAIFPIIGQWFVASVDNCAVKLHPLINVVDDMIGALTDLEIDVARSIG